MALATTRETHGAGDGCENERWEWRARIVPARMRARARARRPRGDAPSRARDGDGEAPTSASRTATDDVYVRARAMCDADDAVIEGLKYAASHEWAKIEGDVATIGITDHAQVRAPRQPRAGGPQLDGVVLRRVSNMH